MKEDILSNTQNPLRLEELYRSDPALFTKSFEASYELIREEPVAEFWNARLNYEVLKSSPAEAAFHGISPPGTSRSFSLVFTIAAALLAGTLVRIADILGFPSEKYVIDNAAFFVLPLLSIYYMIKNGARERNIIIFSAAVCCSLLFMNLIPWEQKSDTRLLSSLHFIFIMWIFTGLAFTGFDLRARGRQMQFLRRNGDVLMLSGIIIICGVMLTGLTAALFEIIGIKLPEFVFENIASYGLASSSIVANYMIESSPRIINKVTPFISRIFTPLILILMTVFLVALAFFAKDPFGNRQELIVFNVLLAVNMGVIVFSFSGSSTKADVFQNKVLLILSGEALLINIVALSAIVYRLAAFGATPNRLAVLGANVLMFINLTLIAARLFACVRSKAGVEEVHKSITIMLPWYTVWAAIAAFVFPVIFWFN